jgi:hypothetical protein
MLIALLIADRVAVLFASFSIAPSPTDWSCESIDLGGCFFVGMAPLSPCCPIS